MDVGAFLSRIGWVWCFARFRSLTMLRDWRLVVGGGGVGWGNLAPDCFKPDMQYCLHNAWVKKSWRLEFALDIGFMHFHGLDDLSTDGERTVLCVCGHGLWSSIGNPFDGYNYLWICLFIFLSVCVYIYGYMYMHCCTYAAMVTTSLNMWKAVPAKPSWR